MGHYMTVANVRRILGGDTAWSTTTIRVVRLTLSSLTLASTAAFVTASCVVFIHVIIFIVPGSVSCWSAKVSTEYVNLA